MSDNQQEIYDAAKEVLGTLLSLMDLSGSIFPSDEFTATDDDGNLTSVGLNIEGEDLGILIGRRGQTMVSLQYIVRLIVSHKMDVQIPIVLDVEGYKQRRCEGLRMLATRLAEQVKNRKAPFTMEPMTAFERRIIHITLADHPDVITESIGVGDGRKVVITPKMLPEN
ncbi:MAG: KH domain-containing protein [Dehalococcoidales bacterium]|nr:KH domain-containing protein [Dehalococcoidales bacterium]